MARDLAIIARQATDLTSLPDLRRWRQIALGTVRHPGQPERKYLAGGARLTAEERARIKATRDKLVESISERQRDDREIILAVVAKMLLAYPMAGGSMESGRARGEAYLEALDDVPPWAVADAVRAWHRGEAGEGRNYDFAPSPATLRALAVNRIEPHRAAVNDLDALLAAVDIETAMDSRPQAAINSLVVNLRKFGGA